MAEDEEQIDPEDIEESHNFITEIENRMVSLMHDVPESVHDVFRRHRRSAFEKHPFVFSTLGLLGLVATWQGFDDVIEQIQYFDANPGTLLIIGLTILLLTGRLYRQVDQMEEK